MVTVPYLNQYTYLHDAFSRPRSNGLPNSSACWQTNTHSPLMAPLLPGRCRSVCNPYPSVIHQLKLDATKTMFTYKSSKCFSQCYVSRSTLNFITNRISNIPKDIKLKHRGHTSRSLRYTRNKFLIKSWCHKEAGCVTL